MLTKRLVAIVGERLFISLDNAICRCASFLRAATMLPLIARCCIMLIRQLTPTWPPAVTIGTEEGVKLEDLVVSAQANPDARGYIVLTLRRATGAEYEALLVVAENLLDKVLLKILEKKGLTLRQLGDVEVLDT